MIIKLVMCIKNHMVIAHSICIGNSIKCVYRKTCQRCASSHNLIIIDLYVAGALTVLKHTKEVKSCQGMSERMDDVKQWMRSSVYN